MSNAIYECTEYADFNGDTMKVFVYEAPHGIEFIVQNTLNTITISLDQIDDIRTLRDQLDDYLSDHPDLD